MDGALLYVVRKKNSFISVLFYQVLKNIKLLPLHIKYPW